MSITKNKQDLKTQRTIIPAKFNNDTVTKHASINYFEEFKRKINFKETLENYLSHEKRNNSKFSTADTMEFIIDAVIQGYSRFSHMEDLRKDNGRKSFKEKVAILDTTNELINLTLEIRNQNNPP